MGIRRRVEQLACRMAGLQLAVNKKQAVVRSLPAGRWVAVGSKQLACRRQVHSSAIGETLPAAG